jgi:hypothetical protein
MKTEILVVLDIMVEQKRLEVAIFSSSRKQLNREQVKRTVAPYGYKPVSKKVLKTLLERDALARALLPATGGHNFAGVRPHVQRPWS